MNGYLIALIVILAYIAILLLLWRSGFARRHNISFMGPLLMLRTEKGIGLLKRMSRRRGFWKGYALLSWALFIGGMISMVLLLLWEAVLVLSVPKTAAPSLQSYLLIPGINPFVPLGYGLIGLIVAVVLHELAHGVLSESQDIDVRSMGVLMFVVPVGAFVEPDQQMLENTEVHKRIKIFGVGPGTNIVLAIIFLMLFIFPFMGGVAPIHNGLAVISLPAGSSASHAGIAQWNEVVAINGTPTTTLSDFYGIQNLLPGHSYSVELYASGRQVERSVIAGIQIVGTVPDSPAAAAGIKPDWILVKMNNTTVMNEVQLSSLFNNTRPGEVVPFVFELPNRSMVNMDIRLSGEMAVEHTGSSSTGFLGIYFTYMGMEVLPMSDVISLIRNPFYGADSTSFITSVLGFLVQPFEGLSPIPAGLAANLHAYGMQPGELFWIGANGMYWLFWLNLWVGLFNMLPAIPLDGGYLFRDNLRLLLEKFSRRDSQEKERIARSVTTAFSYLIFFLILWQLIAIRI